jgi:hypothetical protein
VRDIPGEWIESGPNGEQFYHYGFSYYRRWKRIFPDPLIVEIETFYNLGPGHVAFFLGDYQKARQAIGGDMNLIAWDSSVPEEIATFMPGNVNGAYMTMPDSGTVDVRRERFLEAIINGLVSVDNGSVLSFVNSDQGVYGPYIANPDPVEVTNALLTPYRSGHLYTDMEAAIILAATYEGEGPLRIRITNRLNAGFQVPRGGDKEILIARNEVANVILGYGGTLTGRWPHEMGHIIDFRDPQFRVRRPAAGSACEPLKYLMEFNWWAARYNYDAPDFDWMPISSGLTLARLLTDTYPNSGC